MILVGQYDSFYVRRVAVALHLLDIPFQRDTRSVFANQEEMRRLNPVGRIPSFILDNGEVLVDSGAILDHLDELAGPERALIPPKGAERRHALKLTAIAVGAMDKTGSIVYERTLRPQEKIHQPWIDRCRAQVDSALAALEEALSAVREGQWSMGTRVMQPDVAVACLLAYHRLRIQELSPPGKYPSLQRLLAAADQLDAFKLTMPAPDEQMPSGPLGAK